MNPSKIDQMLSDLKAEILQTIANSRERSLVVTKLDEAELWLLRCAEAPVIKHAPAPPADEMSAMEESLRQQLEAGKGPLAEVSNG